MGRSCKHLLASCTDVSQATLNSSHHLSRQGWGVLVKLATFQVPGSLALAPFFFAALAGTVWDQGSVGSCVCFRSTPLLGGGRVLPL